MTAAEFSTLNHSIAQLRQSVAAVRHAFGDDAPAVRRLVNDLERLEIDAGELASMQPVRQTVAPDGVPDVVVIPDTPPGESMWSDRWSDKWSDADDEGVGGYHGEHT